MRYFVARRIRLEVVDWDAAQQVVGEVAKVMGQGLCGEEAYVLQYEEEYTEQLAAIQKLAQA